MYFFICFRCCIENLKIEMQRITQVDGQPTGFLLLVVILFIFRHCENTNLQASGDFTTGVFFLIHVLFHIITYVLDVVLNLKIGLPRITQVDGQPTGLSLLVVILF